MELIAEEPALKESAGWENVIILNKSFANPLFLICFMLSFVKAYEPAFWFTAFVSAECTIAGAQLKDIKIAMVFINFLRIKLVSCFAIVVVVENFKEFSFFFTEIFRLF